VVSSSVSGKSAHDARLAAVMLVHSITHILTFNATHFARFSAITTVDPHSLNGSAEVKA
jgi:predicted nucleic acid-binding protein